MIDVRSNARMKGVRRVFHVAADYRLVGARPEEIYKAMSKARAACSKRRRACRRRAHRLHQHGRDHRRSRHGERLPNEETRATLDEMIGHYKRSKFLAEQEAIKAASAGMPVVIVNPTAPVGPGDWKPTPTGRIIVDFLNGKMPAYVDTGLNVAPVEDVAAGHLLAAEKGRIGERYILGGRNMTLKQILDALARLPVVLRRGCDCRMRLRWPPDTRTSGSRALRAASHKFRSKA